MLESSHQRTAWGFIKTLHMSRKCVGIMEGSLVHEGARVEMVARAKKDCSRNWKSPILCRTPHTMERFSQHKTSLVQQKTASVIQNCL